jgi:restriction endonuclease Mrr
VRNVSLTVVQVKQYTAVIGVQHVRELRGAMEDKKAGRGVLVTTSTFTKDAKVLGQRFGGQVQLIDGPELVYLIKEVLDKGRTHRQTQATTMIGADARSMCDPAPGECRPCGVGQVGLP